MTFIKKKILVFADWYLPGYKAGGPIRSLANLVNTLDHEFYIVTSNKDHHSINPYPNIMFNTWVSLSPHVHVMYLEDDHVNPETFHAILREQKFDRIYFNSLFSPRFALMPLRAAKKEGLQSICILAPRGMLKSGALSIKSRKKKLFLFIAKTIGLYKGITWHATNKEEEQEIIHHFGNKSNVRIAPNLTAIAENKPIKKPKKTEELRLVCIARISPEKGILEALLFLRFSNLGKNVICDFYGTQQNADYLSICKQVASEVEGAIIQFKGEIKPQDIPAMLADYHFFYMPTLGENFGHAIAESLSSATPVIISDKTPWRHLVEKSAGWDIELDENKFADVLNTCYKMNELEYEKWSAGAFSLGKSTAIDPESISACYSLFD